MGNRFQTLFVSVLTQCILGFDGLGGLRNSMERPLHVVTGAFGYSGRWIAEHGGSFGKRYQNDLKERRYKKP